MARNRNPGALVQMGNGKTANGHTGFQANRKASCPNGRATARPLKKRIVSAGGCLWVSIDTRH